MPAPIIDITLSLQTNSVTRPGFGTPLFMGAHRWFPERVRTYSDILEAETDLPSGSDERAAATIAFSQSPSPTQFKVGRRETDIILTPDVPLESDVFSFTIVDTAGDSHNVTFTALTTPDAEDVVDGLIATIAGNTALAAFITTTKNGATTDATLQIAATLVTDVFSVSLFTKLTDTYPATEAADAVLTAVEAVDEDAYFITAHDHTETFVLALAAAVEARNKLYAVSLPTSESLGTLAIPAVDIGGKLEALDYENTIIFYDDDADTTFPECGFVSMGAPHDPGTITWAFKKVAGAGIPLSTVTGLGLNPTEEDNLIARSMNYMRNQGGNYVTWEGRVASGKYIDQVRSAHFLTAEIQAAFQLKLQNSLKVSGSDIGIGEMQNVLHSTLSRFVETDSQNNILRKDNPFNSTFPRAADRSAADKTSRTLRFSFEAFLSDALHNLKIVGSLSLDV